MGVWGFLVFVTFCGLTGYNKEHHISKDEAGRLKKRLNTEEVFTKNSDYSNKLYQEYVDAVSESQNQANPFVNATWRMSLYEKIKLSVLAWSLFPIRVIATILIVMFLISWTSLVSIGMSKDEWLDKPLSGYRKAFLRPAMWAIRVAMFFWGFYWIKVKGKPAPASEAPVVIANHISFIEPLFLISQLQCM